jgi:DNA invertase Pin-like site-specific DNA recombinase
MNGYIVYYRVSTPKQDKRKGSEIRFTGLGLEAQRTMVARFPKEGPILAEYTEVETGKRADRPQLLLAIAHARATGAVLLIAKLDRLARNVAFTANLMDSDVEFICCDHPSATRLTLHILAAVAEEESRLISERTKAALAEAKKQGVKLGSARPGHWDGKERGWKKAVAAAKEKSKRAMAAQYEILVPILREQRAAGQTMAQIRDWLNERGFKTTRKMPFTEGRVWCIINRYLGKEYLGKSKKLGVMR